MNTLLEKHYKRQEDKLNSACGFLGAYQSLLNYAIDALRGKTACTPEQVSDFIEKRHVELLKEQDQTIFKTKYEVA